MEVDLYSNGYLEIGHDEQRQQSKRYEVQQRRLGGFEEFGRNGGRQQSEEVADQRTVEITELTKSRPTVRELIGSAQGRSASGPVNREQSPSEIT